MSWRLVWAIVLIAVGAVFLLINFGVLPADAWNFLLPAFMILLGVLLLAELARRPEPATTVTESAPLDGATSADVTLRHASGQLTVHAGTDPTLLYAGTFLGGVDARQNRVNGRLNLFLQPPRAAGHVRYPRGQRGPNWDVALNPSVPLGLVFEGGAGETRLDLAGVHLTRLDIRAGASATEAVLPNPTGTLRVAVHSGAGSVKLRLPAQAPASISGTPEPGSLDLDPTRFAETQNGTRTSSNYASATDRIELVLNGSGGSVQIR